MSNNRVIIIGAGLGGLMSGSLLAKEGYRVTVVEKNSKIGGGLQSYKKFGAIFDTGMHIFGGMGPDGNIRRICDYLGISDKFKTCDLDKGHNVEIYVKEDDKHYSVTLDGAGFVDSLAAYFPKQRENLVQYKNAICHIMDGFDLFFLRSSRHHPLEHTKDFLIPADDFIAKYIDDKKLQSLLATINVLYAGEPQITPAFLHSAISTIFTNGACRIAGGYSTFADALADFIKANGGDIRTGERVTRIVTESRHIKEVQTASGETIQGNFLISSVPLTAMVDMMDNANLLSNAYKTSVKNRENSLSAFIVNIKLKRNTLKYSNHIGFCLENYESVWKAYDGGAVEKLMYMTPPVLEQGTYAETLNVILPMKWNVVSQWANTTLGQRGTDYQAFKSSMFKEIIRKLSGAIPGIEEMIEAADTSSPLTIRDYTGVPHGAMCGTRKDCNDPLTFMPVITRIPNLFVTGQNINMHGFCGVSLTAIQTCEAILGKNYIINQINKER